MAHCAGCGNETDNTMCWCGEARKWHGAEHTFVPIGCACYRSKVTAATPQKAETAMHYRNGREAKNGDKVVLLPKHAGSQPTVGILYDAVAGVDHCNGRLAPISPGDPCPNLKECLHLDDVVSAVNGAELTREKTAPTV